MDVPTSVRLPAPPTPRKGPTEWWRQCCSQWPRPPDAGPATRGKAGERVGGGGRSGSLSLGRKAQPASSAAAKMRQSAVRMRFIVMFLMGLLVTEIAQLVVVHQCKVGLAPVEGHLLAGLGVKLEGVGGIGLFPAAHLYAAAGEEVASPPLMYCTSCTSWESPA